MHFKSCKIVSSSFFIITRSNTTSNLRQFFLQNKSTQQASPLSVQPTIPLFSFTNGSAKDLKKSSSDQSDHRVPHTSRLGSFQRSINASLQPLPPEPESPYQNNSSGRNYSPYQAYQNHIASLKEQFDKNIPQVRLFFIFNFSGFCIF